MDELPIFNKKILVLCQLKRLFDKSVCYCENRDNSILQTVWSFLIYISLSIRLGACRQQ